MRRRHLAALSWELEPDLEGGGGGLLGLLGWGGGGAVLQLGLRAPALHLAACLPQVRPVLRCCTGGPRPSLLNTRPSNGKPAGI